MALGAVTLLAGVKVTRRVRKVDGDIIRKER
jgi:hypothetical protein